MEQIRVLLLPEAMDQESGSDASASSAGSDALSHIRRRDQFLELTVSIADYFCRQNQSVIFWYAQGEMREMAVDSYESFRKFYEQIPDLLSGSDGFSKSAVFSGSDGFSGPDGSGSTAPDWETWLSAHGAGEDGTVLILNEKYMDENPLTVWHM